MLNCSKLLPNSGATLETPSGTNFHYLGMAWWMNSSCILTLLGLVISLAVRQGNGEILIWTQQLPLTEQPFLTAVTL